MNTKLMKSLNFIKPQKIGELLYAIIYLVHNYVVEVF